MEEHFRLLHRHVRSQLAPRRHLLPRSLLMKLNRPHWVFPVDLLDLLIILLNLIVSLVDHLHKLATFYAHHVLCSAIRFLKGVRCLVEHLLSFCIKRFYCNLAVPRHFYNRGVAHERHRSSRLDPRLRPPCNRRFWKLWQISKRSGMRYKGFFQILYSLLFRFCPLLKLCFGFGSGVFIFWLVVFIDKTIFMEWFYIILCVYLRHTHFRHISSLESFWCNIRLIFRSILR